MLSTFETLSDEILMIIFPYCGDVFTIFRTFLGLNQRLNNILIDKRLHLFTNFLYIDTKIIEYYQSDIFHNVSQQLLHMHSPINEKELRQCLTCLVKFHIAERFEQLGKQVQTNLARFQTMRDELSDMEIVDIDNQLRTLFFDLRTNVITIESIQQIDSFVLTKAARLQCDNTETSQFNLAKAVNKFLLYYLNKTYSKKELSIDSVIELFKILIISNPRILNSRDHTYCEESSSLWYFLFYSIYQLQYWYYTPPDIFINMKCYNAVIDLLLFSIQCQKQSIQNRDWPRESLFEILNMISSKKFINKTNNVFIENIQLEILDIIINENTLISTTTWQENEDNRFRLILSNLLKNDELDLIYRLYYRLETVQAFFNKPNNIHRNVNLLTGCSKGRELLKIFFDEKPLKSWLISKDLLFLLLQKKERIFLEKLLTSSPFLMNQIDEYGNNPLLFICLKTRGCRHRIIKFLIKIGCDLQRKNINGENFFDAIKLKRNQCLLKDLLEHEIIKINDETGEIQINSKICE